MDWTGYPKALAPDDPVDGLGDLALFLGGQIGDTPGSLSSSSSFIGEVLLLIVKAQATPENFDRLTLAFPREVLAWRVWMAMPSAPSAAELFAALTATPDPGAPPVDVELLPLLVERVQFVAAGETGALSVRGRLTHRDPITTWLFHVDRPRVDLDPRLLDSDDGAATLTMSILRPSGGDE